MNTERRRIGGLEVEVRPAVDADPLGLVVLVHGRGADEFDLLPLAELIDPDERWLVAAPRGPLSQPGMPGAHWYIVQTVGAPHRASFDESRAMLGSMVDELATHAGLASRQVVMAGFSQGAVMSYAVGLGAGRPRPGGVLGFSGFVPDAEGFELARQNAEDLPVAIVHGTHDQVIRVGFGERAERELGQLGAKVRSWWPPIAHGIDPRTVGPAWEWASQTVSRANAEQA